MLKLVRSKFDLLSRLVHHLTAVSYRRERVSVPGRKWEGKLDKHFVPISKEPLSSQGRNPMACWHLKGWTCKCYHVDITWFIMEPFFSLKQGWELSISDKWDLTYKSSINAEHNIFLLRVSASPCRLSYPFLNLCPSILPSQLSQAFSAWLGALWTVVSKMRLRY